MIGWIWRFISRRRQSASYWTFLVWDIFYIADVTVDAFLFMETCLTLSWFFCLVRVIFSYIERRSSGIKGFFYSLRPCDRGIYIKLIKFFFFFFFNIQKYSRSNYVYTINSITNLTTNLYFRYELLLSSLSYGDSTFTT